MPKTSYARTRRNISSEDAAGLHFTGRRKTMNRPQPQRRFFPQPAGVRMTIASAMAASSLYIPFTVQAQGSVTIYGLVDVGLGGSSNGGARTTQMFSGVAGGSRLGFRGHEDLGRGLSANFVLEQGMSLTNGSLTQGGLAFGRQSYVGLSSSSGWSISAGRLGSPLAVSMVATDPFGWAYFGNTLGTGLSLHESPGETPANGSFQATARVNNSVLGTLKLRDVTFAGMVSNGNQNRRQSGRLMSGSLTYGRGPILLTGAFARFKQYAGAITEDAVPQWQNQYLLGANYDFKVAKVFVGYYTFKPVNAGRTAGVPTGVDPRFNRSSTGWIGARVPLGTGTFLVNLMRAKYSYETRADGKSTSLGVAYEYPLSKRTALYANYGHVDNNESGLMSLSAAIPMIIPSRPGANLSAYAFGIRHVF